MAKDKSLEKFLSEWARSEEVKDKVKTVLDKELAKALKAWSKEDGFKPSKKMLKMMSRVRFQKELTKLKKKAKTTK